MIYSQKTVVLSFMFFSALTSAALADYSLRRGNVGTGTCIVTDATAVGPPYDQLVANKQTVEQACLLAKSLKTETDGEAKKCSTYVKETVTLCLAHGVTLSP